MLLAYIIKEGITEGYMLCVTCGKMDKDLNSYEGIVINSLFEPLSDSNRLYNSRESYMTESIIRVNKPAEEKKPRRISIKELYACMSV